MITYATIGIGKVSKAPTEEYLASYPTNMSNDGDSETENVYTAKNRKHFRIKDEKASKSINSQTQGVKSLLEVIQEDVRREKVNQHFDGDQSVDEECLDMNRSTYSQKLGH